MTSTSGEVGRIDLDAIEARANAATQGPWGIESCGEKGDGSNMIGVLFDADVDTNCERPILGWAPQCRPVTEEFIEYYRDELVAECEHRNRNSGNDAEFIAHARTDIPALIAECRSLRNSHDSLVKALEGFLDGAEDDCGNPCYGECAAYRPARAALSQAKGGK